MGEKLGQHFLKDLNLAEKIVEALEIEENDCVLEVGPGKGVLTKFILDRQAQLLAIEKDSNLVNFLEEKFGDQSNMEIWEADILSLDFALVDKYFRGRDYYLVSNLPYYLTGSFLKKIFLAVKDKPAVMILMLQWDVVERILGDSSQQRGYLTVLVDVFAQVELVCKVSPLCFKPSPKVDSAVLKFSFRSQPIVPDLYQEDFLNLVGAGFQQRRKKLSKSLSANTKIGKSKIEQQLINLGFSPSLRAEKLDTLSWWKLYRSIRSI